MRLMTASFALFLSVPAFCTPEDDASRAYNVDHDYAKVKSLCQKRAEDGSATCQTLMGALSQFGYTVPQDYARAIDWYKKSAAQREPWGENGLGWFYLMGWGAEKDYAKALDHLTKAADKGLATAQHGVGWIYFEGLGVPKDHSKAFKYWKKASDQGYADTQQGLGTLYLNGWRVKQDLVEAAKWYKRSADQGNNWGQQGLASMMFNRQTPGDDETIVNLWRASAKQDNLWACNGLGYMLREGRGGPRDYPEAMRFFRKGIELGELSHAPTNLGAMYENGQGVTQDYVEAYKWYLIALAHENPIVQPQIDRIKALMTKEQIAEAQKLAKEFSKPSAQAAPSAPAPVRPPSSVDAPGYKRGERSGDFALVVGVDRYSLKDLPPAAFAERDADAFAEHALALGVPRRNLKLIKGSEATGGKLRGYLESWLPKNVKPGATVYFYFSGHGAPNPKTGAAYLLPWDGDPALLKETASPLDEVYASLGRLKAARVVVVLDACFSGAGGRSVIQKGTRPLVAVRTEGALPPRLSVLAAAAGDETTGALESEGHGLFTYYLLEGLSRGKIASRALCDYLKPKVSDAAARENRAQTPACRGDDGAF